jgi:hypothetical protein
MTPLSTFQWPLSPSGIFQLERSRPLNSETKPAGTDDVAARESAEAAMPTTGKARTQAARTIDFMG